MLARIPKDIPLFCALAGGLGLAAYYFSELFMTARPSSTAGLALVFIPIYACVAAVAALVLGFAVRAAWGFAFVEPQDPKRYRIILPSLLGFILAGASACGAFRASEIERAARPAVLVDTGKLEHTFVANADRAVRKGKQFYSFDAPPQPIVWGVNTSDLVIGADQVQVRDRSSPRWVAVPIAALDYITQIDAVPVALPQYVQPGLAVVIAGRATGGKAMIVVLTPDYEVLFEERLDRFWALQSRTVEVREDQLTKVEAVVVGPGCEKSLVLRARKAV